MLQISVGQRSAVQFRAGRSVLHVPAHRLHCAHRKCTASPKPGQLPCCHSTAGAGEANEASDPRASRLLSRLYEPKAPGAEYGEGFVQFRLAGESIHLDVDTLNEKLQLSGAARMRLAMKPDEAFGMIFNWDGVLVDTRQLQRRAWKKLAAQTGLPFPTMERQIYDIRPERAITEVLQWTRDWKHAQDLAWQFAHLFAAEFAKVDRPLPGVREWLDALHKSNVPCAVISTLDRVDMRGCLERMGLSHYFKAEVTAEDGMDTMAQRYLSAAIKLHRPPRTCVVFDSTPLGITAAHNCTMKAVAVRTVHKGYQLKAADLTCTAMSDLSVYNVRRLFANMGSEFMDHAKLTQHQAEQSQAQGRQRRVLRNATLPPPEEMASEGAVPQC